MCLLRWGILPKYQFFNGENNDKPQDFAQDPDPPRCQRLRRGAQRLQPGGSRRGRGARCDARNDAVGELGQEGGGWSPSMGNMDCWIIKLSGKDDFWLLLVILIFYIVGIWLVGLSVDHLGWFISLCLMSLVDYFMMIGIYCWIVWEIFKLFDVLVSQGPLQKKMFSVVGESCALSCVVPGRWRLWFYMIF